MSSLVEPDDTSPPQKQASRAKVSAEKATKEKKSRDTSSSRESDESKEPFCKVNE